MLQLVQTRVLDFGKRTFASILVIYQSGQVRPGSAATCPIRKSYNNKRNSHTVLRKENNSPLAVMSGADLAGSLPTFPKLPGNTLPTSLVMTNFRQKRLLLTGWPIQGKFIFIAPNAERGSGCVYRCWSLYCQWVGLWCPPLL